MNETIIQALAKVLLMRRGENILGQHDIEEARSLVQDLEQAGLAILPIDTSPAFYFADIAMAGQVVAHLLGLS